jgi:hypothetical protein
VHNDRLIDALMTQAFSALDASPDARASYDQLTARGTDHHAALRQLTNRLVGIPHGCLTTRTCYNEATAGAHHLNNAAVQLRRPELHRAPRGPCPRRGPPRWLVA